MVAIYLRRSLLDKDSLSIDMQLNYCKQKLSPDEKYEVFEDNGFSGKSLERPAMKKLLDNLSNYNKIIVYKLDRISRNLLDFSNLLDKLQKSGVEFVSATENLDTTTPTGRAMVNIIATFAQLERETIAERVRNNYYQRLQDGTGRFLGGTLSFGFENTNIIINNKNVPILKYKPELTPIIKEIFTNYAYTQMSLGEIAKHLNNNNILSTNKAKWDSTKVSRVLRNPLYVKANVDIYNYYNSLEIINPIEEFVGINACNVYKNKLVLTYHNGIIDADVWLKCQYKLKNNKQIAPNKRKSSISWLSTLLKCSCGRKISVKKNSVGKLYGSCNGNCGRKSTIYVDEIHKLVEQQIILKLEELKDVKICKDENNDVKIEITKIDKEIEAYTEKILMANETVMKIINKKIEELTIKKKEIMDKSLNYKINNNIDTNILNVNFAKLDLNKKRDVACTLIEKIIVSEDTVEIVFKV